MNQVLANMASNEPPQKPEPMPMDEVQTISGFTHDAPLSRWQIHPHDTVILDFKYESTFIVKLDPDRPITLYYQSISPRLLIGLYDGCTIQFDPFAVVRDALSEEYFSTDEFWRSKSERRQQQKTLKTARLNIASAFLLCYRRFIQSNSKNAFMLNPASLAFLLDFSSISQIPSRSKTIVCDDFDGVAAAAVCEKLYTNYLFERKCDFLDKCQYYSYMAGYEISEEEMPTFSELQRQCREFLLDFKRDAGIPSYEEVCVIVTGNTTPGAVKDCLVDANMLPNSVEHAKDSRRPTAPPVFHFNLWRFVQQNEALLDNLGIFKNDVAENASPPDVRPLTSDNIIKELDFEYCSWLERRLVYFGVDGALLGRIARLRKSPAGILELTPRGEYSPYYHSSCPHLYFDSLIIAAKTRPLPILRVLQNLLVPGSPVAIFTEVMPPMEELARYVIKERQGTRFQVTKLYEVVQYVLPGRSHPSMIGPLATGYCAGFYIQGAEDPLVPAEIGKKGDFLKNKREKKVR